LAYLITNALKGLVYDDDKRVCAKHVYKFYADEPKTVVRVRPILQAQPLGIMDPSEDICP
jgi:Holliday junction resolvase RusA-like endonuclease